MGTLRGLRKGIKKKSFVDEFYEDWAREKAIDAATLQSLEPLVTGWLQCVHLPSCAHLMGELEGMILHDLQSLWGPRARVIFDRKTTTITAVDQSGYERIFK